MIHKESIKRILVVDDDEGILDILKEILIYEGFEVSSLRDTDNIFTEINKYQPDAIILDYILAGINGGETCHQIKVNPHTSHIPVILMSAHPKVFHSLGTYGCDAFIAKPFELDEVVQTINSLLNTPPKMRYAR